MVIFSHCFLKIHTFHCLFILFVDFFVVVFFFSEQLCAPELHDCQASMCSREKIVTDLQAHQTTYSPDQDQAESEPEPDPDIELELCVLDLEDPDQQEVRTRVGPVTLDVYKDTTVHFNLLFFLFSVDRPYSPRSL